MAGSAPATKKAVKTKGAAATPVKKVAPKTPDLSAAVFIKKLKTLQSDKELQKIQRYFKSGEGQYGEHDQFIGVRMGQVFDLAKQFIEMTPAEIELLLESDIHEARAGALSIMDKQSRSKKISEERLKELYELYMRRHDRINNWDLVDLGCMHMVGSYLIDKPRAPLYKLAKSKNTWERRTAILGTCYFIRQGDLDDTFKIAEIMLHDKEDLIHKATGWMLRFAGAKNLKRLVTFLNAHAATMPRTTLRNCLERFPAKEKKYYMELKQAAKKK